MKRSDRTGTSTEFIRVSLMARYQVACDVITHDDSLKRIPVDVVLGLHRDPM